MILLKKKIYYKFTLPMLNYLRLSNTLFIEFLELFGQDLINNIFIKMCDKYPNVVRRALEEEYEENE